MSAKKRLLQESKDRKKLPLDVLLQTDFQRLKQEYTKEELEDVNEKLQDIQDEVLQSLSYDHEVEEIIGPKLDKDTLWFYVRWDNNKTALIPASILNRLAPDKVINYYEGILTHSSTPKEVLGKEGLRKKVSTSITDKKVAEKQLKEREKQQQLRQLQQAQRQNGTKSDSKQTAPAQQAAKVTMKCVSCSRVLQFPSTAKTIKCPLCSTTMRVQLGQQ